MYHHKTKLIWTQKKPYKYDFKIKTYFSDNKLQTLLISLNSLFSSFRVCHDIGPKGLKFRGLRYVKNVALTSDKKMILFDNEWTMYFGYQFLYSKRRNNKICKNTIMDKVLKVFCVFRRNTIEKVRSLFSKSNPGEYILSYAMSSDPLLSSLLKETRYNLSYTFRKLRLRLNFVMNWIRECSNSWQW